MGDRLEQATALANRVDARWDGARVEAALARLHGKQRRRRVARGALGAALVIAVAVSVSLRLSRGADPLEVAAAAGVQRLRDGSVARAVGAGSLRVVEDTPAAVTVELVEGAARFEVVHLPGRPFVVRAGPVSIVDLGTVFTVERTGGRVHVAVEVGRVRVEGPGEHTEVSAGEARWFSEQLAQRPLTVASPDDIAPAVAAAAEPMPVPSPSPAAPPTARAARGPTAAPLVRPIPAWRTLAAAGKYVEAAALLAQAKDTVRDDVEELLLAADTLRLSNHAQEATPYLQRVVAQHAADARAPLAAFTLGKVLLEGNRPLEAADAFAKVRALAPSGPLSEDALGREVEACARGGDRARAQARARDYLTLFPEGVRGPAVRQLSGLPP